MDDRQPAQLPVGKTENSPTNGDLIGNPPKTFCGDRSKTDQFITQFDMFRMINNTHAVITNPMQRVVLMLTYIRGPKVDDWVSQQFNALSTKVSGDANHPSTNVNTDVALWEDFIAEFKRAFAETSWEVCSRLDKLQMAGDDVETYIATFENLIKRAEYKRESVATVHKFRQGLSTDFVRSIMTLEATPNTIDEWQAAARNEVKRAFMRRHLLDGREEVTDAVVIAS